MSRFLNYRWWVLCLCLTAGIRSASAFSLLGPGESWQTPVMGYERTAETRFPPTPFSSSTGWIIYFPDFSTFPMNLGEEYRWNEPVLYYAYDQSFLDYFGSNGVAAVDAAVAIMNSLSNVSSYSSDLSEFPLREARVNYTAAALHLFDLKSAVLELLVERLGLADPQQWTWALRSRILLPGASCPTFDYGVIQRNFDPVTWEPSRYVNGTLFTYTISQLCSPDFGDAEEFTVDPTEIYQSAVASPKISYPRTIDRGYFHTSLTRDDVGGLRYLYQTNNMNIEATSPDSVLFYTNVPGGLQLLLTSNLTALASDALTNNPAALQALYPNLNIVATTNIYTNIWVTSVTPYFYNDPYASWGTPAQLKFSTNYTLTVQTYYQYTFGNVLTFTQSTNGQWTTVPLPDITTHTGIRWVTVQTTSVTNNYYDAWGTPPHTNTSSFTYATNDVSGEYIIMPTNLCGIAIAGVQATLVSTVTNSVTTATNSTSGTTNTQSFTQTSFYYVTNHVFTYYPVECVFTNVALRQGIEKVTFVRRDYDSLLGQFFFPLTNYYTSTVVTNNTLVRQQIQRVVTQPDVLFSAADLTAPFPLIPTVSRTTPIYGTNGVLPNLAGPGTIGGLVNIQFNKVGPLYLNGYFPFSIDENSSILDFVWGSFDGTTNAPVVYPSGTSIMDLQNQVLIQISPAYLPNGWVNQSYSAQLTTVGATPNWTPPFTWSKAPSSGAWPPGLNISSGGLISGTPTAGGFYEIAVQATDSVGRTSQRSYSLNLTGLP